MIERVGPRTLETLDAGAGAFRTAQPYPHVVLEDFLRPEAADTLLAEFEATRDGWTFLHHVNEKKRQFTKLERLGPTTRAIVAELQSPEFIAHIETLTGISGLVADPDLDGSGLHEIKRGGHLNMHVDFLSHVVKRHWSRRLNLLIYLNKGWREEYNGHLEMWSRDMQRCEKKVLPVFNRCLIFQTSEISWHGHPTPLACPPETSRKSLALYYYRDEGHTVSLASTDYRAVPTDSLKKRALIALDRWALRVYSLLKRYVGLRDRVVSAILKRF
ncbi:MAG: 2OG-Fe(II) oxygenase [Candidatus Rokubacteria bacterium]|nr:2OG-Fe(II) oxygenase [Candidatus Rokubacteria bacterium]MBI2016336.1 2OG-Fe(II) oxygenase [Candidatus Rokubacteria bacterium]